jgi:hypothetical protein
VGRPGAPPREGEALLVGARELFGEAAFKAYSICTPA